MLVHWCLYQLTDVLTYCSVRLDFGLRRFCVAGHGPHPNPPPEYQGREFAPFPCGGVGHGGRVSSPTGKEAGDGGQGSKAQNPTLQSTRLHFQPEA